MDRNVYLKQHKEIMEKINAIENLVGKNDLEQTSDEIASAISTLAGVLNIHLGIEDKFMYPKLANSEDENVKKLALRYKEQMGSISDEFTVYKKKYNTKQQIMNHQNTIKRESEKIFTEIKNRIKREEEELYLYI